MAKQSQNHYNVKFLWSEYLDDPDHKREKDQWSRIVSALPRCKLVKTAGRLLRKRFVEVIFENLWKAYPQSAIRNCRSTFWNLGNAYPQSTICNCGKLIAEVIFKILEMYTHNPQLQKVNCGSHFWNLGNAYLQSAIAES